MADRRSGPALNFILLSGSLRRNSVNTAVLKALTQSPPEGVRAEILEVMGELPHFNPDDDAEPLHPAVARLRRALFDCDGVMISTPEYAASLPGSFKNLLDWTIGGAALHGAPAAWINPSSHGGSQKAVAALEDVLGMAGAEVIRPACLAVAIQRHDVDADGSLRPGPAVDAVRGAAETLARCVRATPRDRGLAPP